jgi:hypothetical protein
MQGVYFWPILRPDHARLICEDLTKLERWRKRRVAVKPLANKAASHLLNALHSKAVFSCFPSPPQCNRINCISLQNVSAKDVLQI